MKLSLVYLLFVRNILETTTVSDSRTNEEYELFIEITKRVAS